MRRETFETETTPYTTDLDSLKRPIDELIALSDKIDSFEVAQEAAHIIDGMREAQSALAQFEQLAALSILRDDLPQVHDVVTDTAEILLEEFNEGKVPPKAVGLNLVWSAVHAWDHTREKSTASLCVTVLNNFRGEGQVALVQAYVLARDKELPFEEALDEVIANRAA